MFRPALFPFRFIRLGPNRHVAVSESGDFTYLSQSELEQLIEDPTHLSHSLLTELQSKFFIGNSEGYGTMRLLASRISQKKETILSGPSLHIIVPTLQCGHTCRYCQVSRTLSDEGFSLSNDQIDTICNSIFESPSQTITVEFQGGDPLLRFDLIQTTIERLSRLNEVMKRNLRFVVASTLHQLTDEMCQFFKTHGVFLSTSIDGQSELHNRNRPIPTRDSYERTVKGIELARQSLGNDAVSALMTTSRDSLEHPETIVDEYVKLGFSEIFLRPLRLYGFAKRNLKNVSYSNSEFRKFYEIAFNRILYWNHRGVEIREVSAALVLNKIRFLS